jgi:TRAP-type C4-dicarboxylate transport system permease small subunit
VLISIKEILHRTCFAISSISLTIMFLLITLEILVRLVTNVSLLIADEFAAYFMVFVAYWGAILAIENDNFVRVDVFYGKYGPRVKWLADLIFEIILVIFVGIMTFFTYKSVVSAYVHGIVSNSVLRTPLFYPKAILLIGLVLLEVYLLIDFYLHINSKEDKQR